MWHIKYIISSRRKNKIELISIIRNKLFRFRNKFDKLPKFIKSQNNKILELKIDMIILEYTEDTTVTTTFEKFANILPVGIQLLVVGFQEEKILKLKKGFILEYSCGKNCKITSEKIKKSRYVAEKFFPHIAKSIIFGQITTKIINIVNKQLENALNKLKYYDDFKIKIQQIKSRSNRKNYIVYYKLIMIQEIIGKYDKLVDIWDRLDVGEKKACLKIVKNLIKFYLDRTKLENILFKLKN